MRLLHNPFKQALHDGRHQIGLWSGLADAYVTELLATTGFDWLLVDGEHAPNDLRGVLAQLQAAAAYDTHVVVRPVQADTALIKQYLDIGAQTLLLPMIDTAEQAAQVVAATRYPPLGVRGVGSSLARASRWTLARDYLQQASRDICVLVQVESVQGLENVAAIAAIDGVDGVFFGPADLSASMGKLGGGADPQVQQAILQGATAVRAAGKAAGILSTDRVAARRYLDAGLQFVAVGVDALLLATAARQLSAEFSSVGQPAR